MGYQVQEMKASTGYNFIVPTFVDVGAATAEYDLQSIVLENAPGDGMTDCIMGYDANACLTYNDYYWQTAAGSFIGVTVDGWYNGSLSTELVEGVTLPFGTGLYLYIGTEGATARYAGQVFTEEFITPAMTAGYVMIGNCTPTPLDLQQIALVNAPGDGMTDCIMGYDANACLTYNDYYWQTAAGSFIGVTVDGWYNGSLSTELVEDEILQPGQGLYFYFGTNSVSVKFPSPIPANAE